MGGKKRIDYVCIVILALAYLICLAHRSREASKRKKNPRQLLLTRVNSHGPRHAGDR